MMLFVKFEKLVEQISRPRLKSFDKKQIAAVKRMKRPQSLRLNQCSLAEQTSIDRTFCSLLLPFKLELRTVLL